MGQKPSSPTAASAPVQNYSLPPLENGDGRTQSSGMDSRQPSRKTAAASNQPLLSKYMLPNPGSAPQVGKPPRWRVHLSRILFRMEVSSHLKSTYRGKLYFGWADRSSVTLSPSLLAPAFCLFRFRYKLSIKSSTLLSVYTGLGYFVFSGLFLTQREFYTWIRTENPLAEYSRVQYLKRFGPEADEWAREFAKIERENQRYKLCLLRESEGEGRQRSGEQAA